MTILLNHNKLSFKCVSKAFPPSFPLTIETKEFKYFQAYLNEDVVNLVVNETNSNYKYYVEQNTVHEVAKKFHTSVAKLQVSFALVLAVPHVKKLVLSGYWTEDNTTDTPLFRKYMTLNGFRQLLRFLHFADNNEPNYENSLWKIRNVFAKIVAQFQEY